MDEKNNKLEDTQETRKDAFFGQNFGQNSDVNPQAENNDTFEERGVDKKVLILATLAFFVIIGFVFWRNSSQLKEAVSIDVPEWALEQLEEQNQTEEEKLVELRAKDTDEDGLNDYLELYQYGTSIFLADTDSDGFSDHEEILQGYDPLCPTGEDCSLLKLITPKTEMSEIIDDINNTDLTMEAAALNEFKAFLLDNGFTQEELELMSDQELMIMLSVMTEVTVDNIDNANIGPEQIRQFLLAQPDADEEAINSLTDEELTEIGKQFISN